jgi:hypothetical protein
MRAHRRNVSSSSRLRLGALSEKKHQREKLAKALRKQYDLLESYAPRWYTQRHHERTESALRRGGKAKADVFIELCGLLEEHAPRWYTKEHSERARSILELLEQK